MNSSRCQRKWIPQGVKASFFPLIIELGRALTGHWLFLRTLETIVPLTQRSYLGSALFNVDFGRDKDKCCLTAAWHNVGFILLGLITVSLQGDLENCLKGKINLLCQLKLKALLLHQASSSSVAPTLAGAVNSSSCLPADKEFRKGGDELLVKPIDLCYSGKGPVY